MGIYDRDYVRSEGGRGRGGPMGPGGAGNVLSNMRMWSVTTWIIIICCAVFLIDGFLPLVPTRADVDRKRQDIAEIPKDAVEIITTEEMQQYRGSRNIRSWDRPLVDPDTNEQIGLRPYRNMTLLQSWFHFSTARGFLGIEFWRFIGFQFLHADLTHLLFNMVGLFFFGPIVEQKLGSKRYAAFYLLCGIFGALLYVLLNLGGLIAEGMGVENGNVPGLIFGNPYGSLIGASAGVFGVIVGGAYLRPNVTVLMFMIIPMRLVTLAWALVIMAMVKVYFGMDNAGGEAAHLGGAAAGLYFIKHQRHLHDFFDFLGRVDPTSHHYREKRTARKSKQKESRSRRNDEQVDAILAKVSREGLQSLTEREKRILRENSGDS